MPEQKKYILVFICLLLSACAEKQSQTVTSQIPDPMTGLVKFYRGPLNSLTAVRPGECPMYPSCSTYSLQCLKKHGPVKGWIMTCDRLMRCGRDELKTAPQIFVEGSWKYYDPVEKNDFWSCDSVDTSELN